MNKLILLVEDNLSDEKLAVLAFRGSGVAHEMAIARDGAEALEFLRTCAELPTVVLLDLKLPKIDGLEVLRLVRADPRTRLLPIVVLTSSKEEDDVVRSAELGANAYVRKPVDFAEFAAAAKNLGVFWLTLNERPTGGEL